MLRIVSQKEEKNLDLLFENGYHFNKTKRSLMSEAYSTLQEISQRFDSEDLALLSNHPDFCFTINSYELFSHHVFSRVKRQNPDKSITHEKTRITIQSDETSDVLHLYPTWKMIEKRVDIEAFHEINEAIERLESLECKHIYLLFPRNENFRKHIPIRSPKLDALGLEYTLKLVPYVIY